MREYIAKQLCDKLGINVTGSSRRLKSFEERYGISGTMKILIYNGKRRKYRCYTEEEYKIILLGEKERGAKHMKVDMNDFLSDINISGTISKGQNENRKKGYYSRITPLWEMHTFQGVS